jgi:hypothetical protein
MDLARVAARIVFVSSPQTCHVFHRLVYVFPFLQHATAVSYLVK